MSESRDDLSARAAQLGALARRLGTAEAGESSTGASSPPRRQPGPGPAPDLAAVSIASELAAASAVALRQAVDEARSAGRTWQELGDVLGVSRQAAFQRFGRPADTRAR